MKKLFFCIIFLFLSITVLMAKETSVSEIQQKLTDFFSKYEQILNNRETEKEEYLFYKNKNSLEKMMEETQPLITKLKNTTKGISNDKKDKNKYLLFKSEVFNKKLNDYIDNDNKIKNIDKILKETIAFLESCNPNEYTEGFPKIISKLQNTQRSTTLNDFQKFKIFEKIDNMVVDIHPYDNCTLGLTITGKIVIIKNDENKQLNFSSWLWIKQICAFYDHILGIKKDGTVVNSYIVETETCNTADWNNIKFLETCEHTVGVKEDGTVVACGSNEFGQCNVSDWKDIKKCYVGIAHTVGVKEDGTVVACGSNEFGQCNVPDWKDIVSISVGANHTVGLKEDGTVVACGSNEFGQCNVSDWKNIKYIMARGNTTLGLKKDGTVFICGENNLEKFNVLNWKGIINIKGNLEEFIGIKKDGSAQTTNQDSEMQQNIKLLKQYDLSVTVYN